MLASPNCLDIWVTKVNNSCHYQVPKQGGIVPQRIGEIEWGQKDHEGEYHMEHDFKRRRQGQGKQLYETLGRK